MGILVANHSPAQPPTSPSGVDALLRHHVEQLNWDEVPLSEVVDWLKNRAGRQVNVVARWRALALAGVDGDTLVSIDLHNVTMAQVLDEIMDQLSFDSEITFHGEGNILKITSKSDADRKLYTRTYDVAKLLFDVPDHRGAPSIDLSQPPAGGAGGRGRGADTVSVFAGSGGGNDDDTDDENSERERGEALMRLIRTVIEPDTWDERGGEGSLVVFDRVLTVRNTRTVHELLAGRFGPAR